MRKLLVFLCFMAFAYQAWATDYYIANSGVDTNTFNCDQTHPCQTWNFVRPKLAAGDTAYFRGGTYPGFLINTSNPVPSGTSDTNRTTISGFASEVVTFTSQVTISWFGSTFLEYLLLKKFTVNGAPLNAQSAGYGGSSRIRNLRWEDIIVQNASGTCVASSQSGITDSQWIRIKAIDCGTNQLDHGFYIAGERLTFDNVEAYGASGYGFQAWDSTGCLNTCISDLIVRNSSFHGNGFRADGGGMTLSHGHNMRIYNNIIYGNKNAGIDHSYGSPQNAQIENNTIYNNGQWGITLGNVGSASTATSTKVRNNIFSANTSGSIQEQQVSSPVYATNLCPSLPATGCSVTGSPGFTNAGAADFTLTASSNAKNTGTTLTTFSTDRVGQARGQGGVWDIGAYEFIESGTPVEEACPGSPVFYISPSGLDTNSGTQASPFRTINKGMSMLAPGATLCLRNGTYNETILWRSYPAASGASWSVPVRMMSYPGEMATIQHNSGLAAPNGTLLDLGSYGATNDIQYIIFNRLIFDGTTHGETVGITSNCSDPSCEGTKKSSHHIRFDDVEVRNSEGCGGGYHIVGPIAEPGPTGTGNGMNVSMFGFPHHVEWLNSRIHKSWCGYGIYMEGSYHTVHNTDFYDNCGYGVQVYYNGCEASGLETHCSHDLTFSNNRFYGNGYCRADADGAFVIGTSTHNVTIVNNLFYRNNKGASIQANSYNTQFSNNTVVNNSDIGLTITNTTATITAKNNIVWNNGGGNLDISSSPGIDASNNLTANPLFVDSAANDYHLTLSSGARNAGTALAVGSPDRDGVARPQGSQWDIGAYEYVEGGGTPVSGNPIYVAKTGSSDSNDCTAAENASTPKLTLASACQCMTVPGKIMYIKAGTYQEKWDTLTCPITGGNGPSFTDATIIAGFASDVVTLQLPSGTVDTPAFFLRNGLNDKYTIYRNLIIDANNQVGSNGIALYPNVHHIRFENVEVKNTLNGYETVYIYNVNNIGFYDSRIHHSALDGVAVDGTVSDVTFQRCKMHSNGGKGIHLLPGQTINNLSVKESEVSSNTLDGLDLESGTAILLVNNRIYSNGATGIVVRAGLTNVQMYFQSITGNATYGIDCASGVSGAEIKNVIAYNNTAGQISNSCGAATATNFTTNPLFTNAATGDLTLQDGSGAIDQGTPIAGISNDFAGLSRPQGATDIGSEERLATPVGPGSDVTVRARLLYQTGMFY